MNITKESDDYTILKQGNIFIKPPFSYPTEEEKEKALGDLDRRYYYATGSPGLIEIHRRPGVLAEDIIKDKLKTTVDAGLTKLPVLKIKLSKLFKWWK